jgi:protein YIPF5/7
MANYGYGQQNAQYGSGSAQNLQFYPSSYSTAQGAVSGSSTPFQASYGGAQSNAYGGAPNSGFGGSATFGPSGGFGQGFGGAPMGRMGEQGGLRTGWLAAFGTEGYEGEPPLLEELGVNFGHIKMKVDTFVFSIND